MGRHAMIKQIIHIKHYWIVIVYYNVDYNFFDIVEKDLYLLGASEKLVSEVYEELYKRKAKAVTYSALDKYASVVLFNKHNNVFDYLNSLVHEAEHVKQAMLEAYEVKDSGEPPAYTVGYLMERMFEVFKKIL